MEQPTNPLATASLVMGLLLPVLYFGGMCLSFVPFLGLFSILLLPVEWLLAIGAIVTGVLGFKRSAALQGQLGRAPSMLGALIGVIFILFQLFMLVMMGGLVTLMVGLSLLQG